MTSYKTKAACYKTFISSPALVFVAGCECFQNDIREIAIYSYFYYLTFHRLVKNVKVNRLMKIIIKRRYFKS